MEESPGYHPGWRCLIFRSDSSVHHWTTKTHIRLWKINNSLHQWHTRKRTHTQSNEIMSDLLLETSNYSGKLPNWHNTTTLSGNHNERHKTSVMYMSSRISTLITQHDFHPNKVPKNHCFNVSCPAFTYMWTTGWSFRVIHYTVSTPLNVSVCTTLLMK